MTDTRGEWNAAEQAELMKVFYSGAFEQVENLQDALMKLDADPDDAATLRAAKRYVHTLKGDSGSMGLVAVAALCHRMEDVLAFLTEGSRDGDRHEAIDLLLFCVDGLTLLLPQNGNGDSKQDAAHMHCRIDDFLGQTAQAGEERRTAPAVALNEYQRLQIREALAGGLRVYEADIMVHPECGEKSIAARIALQRVGAVGSLIHPVSELGFEKNDRTDRFTVVFVSDRTVEHITRNVLVAGIISEVRVREHSNSEFPILSGQVSLRNAEFTAEVRTQLQSASTPELRTEMLRVEASRVDRLMNLVGELIIGHSMVDQVVKELGANGMHDAAGSLRTVHAYLERTVADLRKGVMKMRMVPVNHVFRKLPRMVRDLSVDKGKSIRIEVLGKDTELDKGIVDSLGEPLAHIIRNMVDHGIEAPELRRAAGKPEEGLITVRAYHEGAQIVIEATDDGKGIDTQKLRRRAAEKGLIAHDEAAGMTDAEAIQLLFLPGVSTADTVTETSGRGVGMDAVRTSVENMRGTIEISSTPGAGTLVRMRLPLTLAVIRALLFQTGEKLYAVPLSVVAEITKVMQNELTTVDSRDTLILRDQTISLVRVEALLNLPASGEEKKIALILNVNHKRIGLLVDRIASQQDLVIKSLAGEISRSDMIAGASILGDGKVVIILDAQGMVRKAIAEEKKKLVAA